MLGCNWLQADLDHVVRKQKIRVNEVRCLKAGCVVALSHPAKKVNSMEAVNVIPRAAGVAKAVILAAVLLAGGCATQGQLKTVLIECTNQHEAVRSLSRINQR